jgi:hypothetical protein
MRRRWRGHATLDDVVELLQGVGVMLQKLDARLEKIVALLEEEADGQDGS